MKSTVCTFQISLYFSRQNSKGNYIDFKNTKSGFVFPFFLVLLQLRHIQTASKNWSSFCSLYILTNKTAFNKGEILLTGSEKCELAGALEKSSYDSQFCELLLDDEGKGFVIKACSLTVSTFLRTT
jgi:hypothetical protein